MRESSLAAAYPDLAKEWHPEKNGDLTPADVTPGSRKSVWWCCGKGHEWQAVVKGRTNGNGCPYCSNRRVLPGENDLGTTHPEVAAEWHPTKNGVLTPQTVTAGSRKKVWWLCSCGYEWQASVRSRTTNHAGSPACAGKVIFPGKNDLATLFPEVAAEWHPVKNGLLTPQTVTAYSNRKVWWICEKGHEYQAIIAHRTQERSGCPYCANRRVLPGFNDLQTVYPKIAAQWHPHLNGNLTPQMVPPGSSKKVWWKCSDGHEWKALVSSRTGPQKCGCPVCAGRFNPEKQKRYEKILAESQRLGAD